MPIGSGETVSIGTGNRRGRSIVIASSTLKMGDIVFKDPWLVIAPMVDRDPDIILGMHDLGSLHLYFAYREGKLYASTVRGDMTRAAPMPAPMPRGHEQRHRASPMPAITC